MGVPPCLETWIVTGEGVALKRDAGTCARKTLVSAPEGVMTAVPFALVAYTTEVFRKLVP
jgi:hypothetical protein